MSEPLTIKPGEPCPFCGAAVPAVQKIRIRPLEDGSYIHICPGQQKVGDVVGETTFEISIPLSSVASMDPGTWYDIGKVPAGATVTYAGPSPYLFGGYVIRGHYGEPQKTLMVGDMYDGPDPDDYADYQQTEKPPEGG